MDAIQSLLNKLDAVDQISDKNKPKTLGSGFVTSVLGEGGASIVYEIWNPKLEIHRAVKLWRPNISEKNLQRFETEIKITSKLNHPNIVEIHTVGEWNGLPYIEMERIDGYSLQMLLDERGAFPPVVALAITIFICRALSYAHQEEFTLYGRKRKGVIHCDIKPANIMITHNGTVKLMDFGIANPTDVSLHNDPNKVTGSLQYMAPEQIRSHHVDARTDIYSMGAVLYEMLSGTKAFHSYKLLELIEKRKNNDYVPLNQLCPNLPKKLYRIVSTCMEPRPEERYQNVNELCKNILSLYRKYSSEDPQKVIMSYIENKTVINRKIPISRHTIVSFTTWMVPSIILVSTLILFSVFLRRNPTTHRPHVSQPQIQKSINVQPPEGLRKTDISENTPRFSSFPQTSGPHSSTPAFSEASKNLPPSAPAAPKRDVPSSASRRSLVPSISQNDPLSVLQALVEEGNLSEALKRFEAKTINDGAYYYLYARCLYERGDWKKAYENAEASLRFPSTKVTQNIRLGQCLLYKAKYLSHEYDEAPSPETAQAAIDAWWKVREHFDGTSENAKAKFAESEISRLSRILER